MDGAARGLVLAGVLVLAPHLAVASPLTKPEVLKLVRKHVQESRLLGVVRELGIDFKVTPEIRDELRAAGATASLITSLQEIGGAEAPAPATVTATPVPPPLPVTPPPAPPEPTVAPTPSPVPAAAPTAPAPAQPVEPVASSPAPPPAPTEPPPAPAFPRAAVETMVALIPGPPPPPPPPLIPRATAPTAEVPSEPPATAPAPVAPPAPPVEGTAPAPVTTPPPAEPASTVEQVRPLLEKARALAAEGDVRGAQMLVVKAMELDPVEPEVWKTFKGIEQELLVRAETFLSDGQVPRALREFQFIITTNPESAPGHNGVGLALLELKNYAEAVAAFERALALEPGNARYRQALTRARSLQKASKVLERQGQQNLKEMIEDEPGKRKGP